MERYHLKCTIIPKLAILLVILIYLSGCSGETFDQANLDYTRSSVKPEIKSLQVVNNTLLRLEFNIDIDKTKIKESNFEIIGENEENLGITEIISTESGLDLVTDSQMTQNYNIITSGIQSKNTVIMEPSSQTFLGDGLPEITNVTSSSPEGSYSIGSSILIEVIFAEPVTVDGAPFLELETGTIDGKATYISGSGSNTLVFQYDIQPYHSTANLDYIDTDSLKLNSATILDSTGNNGVITLVQPGQAGSLSNNKSFSVDTTKPLVSFVVSSQSVNESIGTATIQVQLSALIGMDIVVPFTVDAPSTASGSGVDYTIASSSITFPAGTNSQNISLSIVNDLLDEFDESIIIQMGTPNYADYGANTSHTITITDDDAQPTVTLSTVGGGTIAENGATETIRATLSAPTYMDVTVNYLLSGSATLADDYTMANSVVIPAGNTTGDIILTSVADLIDEGAGENVIIDINTVINGTESGSQQVSVTITDDDTASVTITGSPLSLDETGPTSNTYDIVLDTEPTNSVTINMTTADGETAVTSANPITFTPGNWNISQTVTVQAVDDTDYELAHTGIVTHTPSSLDGIYNSLGIANTAVNITDNDSPPIVNFTSANQSSTGELGNMTITAQLSILSDFPVLVPFSVNGASTASGGDYSIYSSPITIAAGTSSSNITIFITPDTTDEPNETVIIDMGSPNGGSQGSTIQHIATITDDDAPPAIQFTSTSSINFEDTSPAPIQIEISSVSSFDVTVDYSLSGTAIGGGDDYTLAGGTATITAGNTTTNISLPIINDVTGEDNETVVLTLSGPTNASLRANQVYTHTIRDNDYTGKISFASANSNDSETVTTINIPVSISSALGTESVDYTVTGGTASSGGVDYTLASGTLSFPPSSTSENIVISINNDTLYELDETIQITLSNPVSANFADPPILIHTYTINNDDPIPTVGFTLASQSALESAGTMTVTVEQSAISGLDTTMPFTVSGTATGGGTDYTITGGPVTILAGSTTVARTIIIVSETRYENDETIIIDMGTPTNATASGITTHTATINNDDSQPTVSFASTSQSNSENSGSMSITAQLSNLSDWDVSVPFSVNAGSTATGGGTDYSITVSPISITAGNWSNTITITLTDDALEESNETVIVDMGYPTNATQGATTWHTATITDDDRDGPQITIAEYYDTDQNGRIDHVKLTFDETLNDSSLDGWNSSSSPNDQLHDVTTAWKIAGFTNVRLDTRDTINLVTGDDATNDAVIWLAFDEMSNAYDTDSKPDLTAIDSTLTDLDTGNCYVQTSNANCLIQASADIITVDVTEIDKAAPVIIYSSGRTGSQNIVIAFSEPVDSAQGGGCQPGDTLTKADFSYVDTSSSDNNDLANEGSWPGANGCDDNKIIAQGVVNLAAGDLGSDAIAPVDAASIYDGADNGAITTAVVLSTAIPPYVQSVVTTSTTSMRILFSEAVDLTQATTLANYSLTEYPVDPGCGDVSLSAVIQKSSSEYELTTDAAMCSSTTYQLSATTGIFDENEGLTLSAPLSDTFIGAEALSILSVSCVDINNILVVFNKAVDSTTGEDITLYLISGATDLGTINNAVKGSGADTNKVTITHTNVQSGGSYTIIGSNGTNGDGFDDNALVSPIQDEGLTENLQLWPGDRATFVGCGL